MVIMQDLQSHRERSRGVFASSETYEETIDISNDSNDPNDLDGRINLCLDDEPGSLPNYLQTRREDVRRRGVRSVPGLSFNVEIIIYDCLILQLYHERVCGSERVKEIAAMLVGYIDKSMRQA